MPPKRTGIEKLREDLRKQKIKQQQELKQVKSSKKVDDRRLSTLTQIKKFGEEEEKLHKFFTTLVTVSDEDMLKAINTFATEKNAPWGRSQFFAKLTELPETLIKPFAVEYIDQDSKSAADFYQSYIERPKIKKRIAKMSERLVEEEKLEEDELETIRLEKLERKTKSEAQQQVEIDLFGEVLTDSDEEEIVEEGTPGGLGRLTSLTSPKKVIKILGVEGEKIVTPSLSLKTARQKIDPNCLKNYRDVPWVKARVDSIWLSEVDDSDLTEYTTQDTKEENDRVWKRANRRFAELMCIPNASKRVQDGNILTTFTDTDNRVNMMVAYQTNRGFIVQDESLFSAEKQYHKEKKLSRHDKIEHILSGPVTPEIKKIGADQLSSYLQRVSPGISDYAKREFLQDDLYQYSSDTPYITKAIDTVAETSSTVREFYTKIVDVIVYLLPWTKNLGNEIFAKRIRTEYYLPEILVNLSPAEKLPEMFDDPRVPESEHRRIANIIGPRVKKMVYDFGEATYIKRHPTERRPTVPSGAPSAPTGKIFKWKSACVNAEDAQKYLDEDVVYYNEDQDIYCLPIPLLWERFNEDNYNNPYTDNPLSDEFVLRFQELYDLDKATPVSDAPTTEKRPVLTPVLAPDLLDIMMKDILELEEELVRESPSVSSSISEVDTVSNFKSNEDDKDGTMKDNSEELSSSACYKCKKFLKLDEGLKSVIDHKDGGKVVRYCSFKCFENSDTTDWPKICRKKQKKKRKRSKSKSKSNKKQE